MESNATTREITTITLGNGKAYLEYLVASDGSRGIGIGRFKKPQEPNEPVDPNNIEPVDIAIRFANAAEFVRRMPKFLEQIADEWEASDPPGT